MAMNPIQWYVARNWRVTSNPHAYRDWYPDGPLRPFGERFYTVNGYHYDAYCKGMHEAWDMALYDGAPIETFADGEIVSGTGWGTFGYQTVVAYPKLGIQVIYGHQKPNIPVKVGQKVKRGDVIGYQGSSNNQNTTMASHLHIQFQEYGYIADIWEFTCTGIDALKIDIDKGIAPPAVVAGKTHTVVKGDTLYSLSRKYDMTVDDLKALNGLKDNVLSIGQELRLDSGPASTTHTVVKGDTLYSLSKKYDTSVNAIKALNDLDSNVLSIGQVLKMDGGPVPTKPVSEKPRIEPFTYTKDRARSLAPYAVGRVDTENVHIRNRKGSRRTGFNWNTDTGDRLHASDNQDVYVYESHDGWLRIYTGERTGYGSNRWIYGARFIPRTTFK